MNAQRLNDIYSNIQIAEKSDIESIKQLMVDYPFYHLPYVVMAKYYFDTSHYKFEDMLRQAAMRVRDRRELYHYIHGNIAQVEPAIDPDNLKYEQPETIETFTEPVIEADQVKVSDEPGSKAGLADFLGELAGKENEKPVEFVFEGKHELTELDEIEIDNEPVGEEVGTEFSFSKPLHIVTDTPAEENKPGTVDEAGTVHKETNANGDLRKSPVYNVETFINEGSLDIEEDLSSEKDFFAWLQHPQYSRELKEDESTETKERHDQRTDLIDKFININPQISRPKKEFFNPENMAKKSEVIDMEYVTETLANIYYEQGNYDLAVKAYEKLSLQNPSKQAFFASLIEKIRKERKQ
jgi:tetratricopeptide (TPR) repeat protein